MNSIIPFLSSSLGRRDEVPNIELGQRIASADHTEAVEELIGLLRHKSKDLRYDALKTLYEIGYIKPALLAKYFSTFLALLDHPDNRMQWGSMIALHTIVHLNAAAAYEALGKIIEAADKGSVVTRDHCVKIMAQLAQMDDYRSDVLPLLFEQILGSPINQLPMYIELTAPAVDARHKNDFLHVLNIRLEEVALPAKRKRIEKVIRQMG